MHARTPPPAGRGSSLLQKLEPYHGHRRDALSMLACGSGGVRLPGPVVDTTRLVEPRRPSQRPRDAGIT